MTDIYESPDKGETVYVRKAGESERTLHSESKRHSDLYLQMQESKLWGEIRREAKTNVALADILNQAVMIYELTKTRKN